MGTFLLIAISGIGLGSLYFLLASGLSLIFGLMRVLSFSHGAFLTVSAYVGWAVLKGSGTTSSTGHLIVALAACVLAGGILALLTELTVIRRLAGKELEQLLATVGLGMALVALINGVWGPDDQLVPLPSWVTSTSTVFGANIPNNRFLLIGGAILVMLTIRLFLRHTRYGLIIRAGVENREMVSALGIDVRRSFTFVFVCGGLAAGLAGGLAACYYRSVTPFIGDHTLIYAFIVLIVGGLGSIEGAALAAVVLGLVQSLVNFYVDQGLGDILVVVLLAATLLVRPQGLLGRKARLV